jgi:hypothetical protein
MIASRFNIHKMHTKKLGVFLINNLAVFQTKYSSVFKVTEQLTISATKARPVESFPI